MPAGVQAGHAHRVLGGLGAAVGEEHHVEVAGVASSAISRAASLRAGVGVERRDGAQHAGLLLDGGDELGVLVADVDVDQLAGEVEVAGAVLGPEPAALGAGDHQRGEAALRAPGVEDVGPVVVVRSAHWCTIPWWGVSENGVHH